MMKRIFCCIVLLLIVFASQAEIYKWRDKQGNVHFGDKPHKGATQIELPEVQTFSPPPVPESSLPEDSDSLEGDTGVYKSINIVQPKQQETIRNNQGLVTVFAELTPALQPGDQLQLIYDGASLGPAQTAANFILNNVYRGAHTIAIQIQTTKGKVLKTSEPVTFFMHRPRVGMVPHTRAR